MKRKMKVKGFLMGLLFAMPLLTYGQSTFKYKAGIPKVDTSGFYKINLQPNLVAKSKTDNADIRIVDEQGNFVPYLKAGELPDIIHSVFTAFARVAATANADTVTAFTVANESKLPLNSLSVQLKNTAVSRTVNLLGSDDLKHWFAIQEHVQLANPWPGNKADTYFQSITFPQCSYHYFKVLVNDKNKAPVNIVAMGTFKQQTVAEKFVAIAPTKVTRKDSGNHSSYLHISFKEAYAINKIKLDVENTPYFKRVVVLYQTDAAQSLISQAEISPGNTTLSVSGRYKDLILQIINNDDKPLKIAKVTGYQLNDFVVAYLKAGADYNILTGNDKAQAPEYDLKFFADSIGTKTIRELSHASVSPNNAYKIAQAPKKSNQKVFIWIAIGVAILTSLLLTGRMVKEVNAKKQSAA